jgi:hypothetical protein
LDQIRHDFRVNIMAAVEQHLKEVLKADVLIKAALL